MPTILVVDDNPDIRHLVSYIIQEAGHSVLTAGNGEEALELVRTNEFDLALLDVRMPGMSGIELCGELRADHSRRRMPIIMVTAHASAAHIDAAYAAGADDYVVKPFRPQELVHRVEAALAKASREAWMPALGMLATVARRSAPGDQPARQPNQAPANRRDGAS
jgi:two-component system phosphate regulon response regulator PhoB